MVSSVPESLEDAIGRCLERAWEFIRTAHFNMRAIDADESLQTVDPDHLGAPASKLDRLTHQFLEDVAREELGPIFGPLLVGGEEASPLNRVMLQSAFSHIVHFDAIDGTTQLDALGMGWGSVIFIQRFSGTDDSGQPRFDMIGGGLVNSAGEMAIHVRTQPAVELRLANGSKHHPLPGLTFTTSQSITVDSGDGGNSDDQALAIPGYKASQWDTFQKVRTAFPTPLFNSAGAPITPSVLQGGTTAAQTNWSTLWDGISALLVGAAGGVVMVIGESAPRTRPDVLRMFDASPFTKSPKGETTWSKPIPPYAIGVDFGKVASLSAAITVDAESNES